MKKKFMKYLGCLGMAVLLTAPMKVSASEEQKIEVYPHLYEDGTVSPVTSTGSKIFANGTSLIFKDGKMYEDLAPLGVFGANDRHIYTGSYIEYEGEVYDDGMHEEDITYTYVETGGTDEKVYGDCQLTIDNTTLRGVYVDHVTNVSVNVRNAEVLRHYIENAAGNVNYTIDSNVGFLQEIYMKDMSGDNNENKGLVQGNLNLTLKNVKSEGNNINILASGTVYGDTNIVVKDSAVYRIDAAHITGNGARKGNVSVKADNSEIGDISGTSNGYHSSASRVNGDIDIQVKNCEMEFGISEYTDNTYYCSTGEELQNVVTGKGTVYVENSELHYIKDKVQKVGSIGESGENTEVTVKNSVVSNEIATDVIQVYGNLESAEVKVNEFYAKDKAVFTGGRLEAAEKISGKFIWQARGDNYHSRIVLGHNYYTYRITPSTANAKGYTTYKCSRCGHTYNGKYTDKLPSKKSVSRLNYTLTSAYTYTGKDIRPTVTVKDGKKKLQLNKDYKVTYKNNKNIGTASMTITGKGSYTGAKKLSFKILPKKNSITYIKSNKANTISLKWKKDTKATGYVIQYSTDKNFKKGVKKITISKNKTTSATLQKLKAKKNYYVRVASYKKVSKSTYTGKYSTVKKVQVRGGNSDKVVPKKSVRKLKYTLTSAYTYTGKSIKPTVTVKDSRKKLKLNKDYKVTYKNNKNIGTASITITGKGSYTGTKKLSFKIVPKKSSITYIKSRKANTISLKWKKDTKASGYVIQYSADKNFKKGVKKITISKNKTTSTTLKKLKAKKNYYVRVASYKKAGKNTYTGKYSTAKRVKVR